jgi:hypothetical protein
VKLKLTATRIKLWFTCNQQVPHFFCNFILDVSSKTPDDKAIAPIKAVRKTFARVSESVF